MRHIVKKRTNGERGLAIKNGDYFYYTGRACKHGHFSKRYTSNSMCLSCCKMRAEESALKNRDWYVENKDRKLENSREWYQNNRRRKAITVKLWREQNPEKVKEIKRAHNKRYPARRAAACAVRRARIKSACPDWVDREALRKVYETAAWIKETTGLDLHVDHIVPIAGKTVCGLHVPWNLQIISKERNQRKSATFDPLRA